RRWRAKNLDSGRWNSTRHKTPQSRHPHSGPNHQRSTVELDLIDKIGWITLS
ncbi:hypothetical protein M5D96_011034, partial [Drosophila gunungcola]